MSFRAKITASHYILPKQVLTNEDLYERFGEKKVKGISKLSGISGRTICPRDVTSVDLATEAAKRMIESLNIDKSDFDMLIFASQTRDYILPCSAFVIHNRLQLPCSCGSFDIPMGCAAFPYAMSVGNGLIASGQCKKILLLIADTITHLINPKDRGLVTLHGDGAAAFVLERSEDETGFEFVEIGSDSSGWKYLIVPAGGMKLPISEATKIEHTDASGITTTDENLQMNGEAVFHFSISTVPNAIKSALAKNSADIASYKYVLLHQANLMMLNQIYQQLGVEKEKRFFFMENVGNLSCASSPVVLAELLRTGGLNEGGRVLISAFGVGLTWGTFSMSFESNSVKVCKESVIY